MASMSLSVLMLMVTLYPLPSFFMFRTPFFTSASCSVDSPVVSVISMDLSRDRS